MIEASAPASGSLEAIFSSALRSPAAISSVCLRSVMSMMLARIRLPPLSNAAVGDEFLLSEVTRDAVARLQLTVGQRVCALVKSVSIEVQQTNRSF